jgi:FixJ family two-component response regulator
MNDAPIVYLVDDDPSVARAVGRLFRVAGFRFEAFATAGDFLNQDKLESPSCAVLDVEFPDGSGPDLQRALNARGRNASIVFITGHGNIPMAVEALWSGAVHFLPKPFDNRQLLATVQQALDRERQAAAQSEETRQIEARVESLTPRESEVFVLVAAGLANKMIAHRLEVSLQTVKLHRGRVMQ